MRILFLAAALAIGVAAPPVWSQTAVLSGSVLRDSAGHPIQGAQISIPKLGKLATSNAFEVASLPSFGMEICAPWIGCPAESRRTLPLRTAVWDQTGGAATPIAKAAARKRIRMFRLRRVKSPHL